MVALALTLAGARNAVGEEPPAASSTSPRPNDEIREIDEIEEIQVLGFRTGQLADDPSSFATVIELEGVRAEFKSLEDVLSQSVGVQVRRFGGVGERSEVAIRGSTSSQVVVVVDGVRLNSSRGGGVDLSDIPFDFYDTVEIARGGGSLGQGSGAMGGVIQLKASRPGDVPVTRFALSGGSFGTWRGSLLRSARTRFVDYSIGYSGFKTDGDYSFLLPEYRYPEGPGSPDPPVEVERINNRREKHALQTGLGRELGRFGYLQLRGDWSYASHGEPGLDSGGGEHEGQRLAAHQREFHSLVKLGWEATGLGIPDTDIEADLYYRLDRIHFEDPAANAPEGIDDLSDDSTLGVSVSDFWEGDMAWSHLRAGLELAARRDALRAEDRANHSRWTVGTTLRGEARLFEEGLIASLGLRYDWTEGLDDRWLPSLGIVYWPFGWLRFKGNIERSFRAPSFDELYFPDKGYIRGNPDLEAEEALNGDVGFELIFDELGPFRDVRMEASYFHNRIDNSIVWVVINPSTVAPLNTGRATVQGYELLASLELFDLLRLSANHTGVDARYDRSGARLPGRAESETNARLEVGNRDVWKLVGEMHRTGDIYASEAGGRIIPARTVWSGSASLNLARLPRIGLDALLSRLWLTFRVNNIGDVAQRDAMSFPQPGRALALGLEGAW